MSALPSSSNPKRPFTYTRPDPAQPCSHSVRISLVSLPGEPAEELSRFHVGISLSTLRARPSCHHHENQVGILHRATWGDGGNIVVPPRRLRQVDWQRRQSVLHCTPTIVCRFERISVLGGHLSIGAIVYSEFDVWADWRTGFCLYFTAAYLAVSAGL